MGIGRAFRRYWEINDFTGGWNNVSKPTTFNPNEFSDIKNYNITRHRGLEKRGGLTKLYPTTSTASTDVKNLYEYKAPNGDNYNLIDVGTKIRAYFDAQWNDLKTGLTAGKKHDFATHRGFCYAVNGIDANFKLYNTTSYNVGIEKPASEPVVLAIATGTEALTSTHPTANADLTGKLRSTASQTLLVQSFKLPDDYELSTVIVKARKVGTPSGGTPAIWAEIHTSPVGTAAVKNASANIVTASSASANVNPATGLTTSFVSTTFTFSTAPVCSKDTTYYLVIYGDFTVSTTNYVEIGFDNSDASYIDGMYHEISGSMAWTDVDTIDMVFEINGVATSEVELVNVGGLETGNDLDLMYDTTHYLLAQSFQVTSASSINSIRLPLKEVGNIGSDNIWAEIHSSTTGTVATKGDSANLVPNGTTDSIGKQPIDNDEFTWVTFTFPIAPSLSASTTYYLVLYSDGTVDTTNYVEWTLNGSSVYTSGQRYVINSAFTWSSATMDFSFKIYGTQTATQKGEEYPFLTHSVGAVTFVGTGRDDCISGGTYTHTSSLDYKIEVDGVGATNTFKWSDDGGSTWDETTVAMTGSAQTLNNGVTVTFATTIYHVSGDYWTFTASAIENWADYKSLREDTSHQMLAQAFTTTVTADCTKVVLYLSQVETIAGSKTIWAEIHNGQDGTSDTQDGSTRINGTFAAASATPDAISAYPTYDTITFTFGGTKPSLVAGTTYYLVLYGDYDASTTNYLKVQMDRLPPGYADGNAWKINTSEEWTELPDMDLTFQVHQVTGGQKGAYKYIYTYKRSDIREMESNPSDESETVSPSDQSVNVTVVASTDSQVDDIVIYRTLASGTKFYKVAEVTNSAQTYKDDLSDNEITILVEYNNNVPPKAKYLVPHKDRIFYLNCPAEESGGSLAMWSKSGNGEQVPTKNYQYFDREDGEDITGGVSLSDYLLIFKRNKIAIVAGELDEKSELWYLSPGIGAVSHWTITPFGDDKVQFLSEEGWKVTDGKNIWSLSTKINGLIGDGYFTDNEILYPDFRTNYSTVYYPEKEHFQCLINHNSLADYVFVGHDIAQLLQEELGQAENILMPVMRWTRHQYDNHELTCLGTYTDTSGITKVIAGASDGFVYLLDSGDDDDGTNIATSLVTDWLNLGMPGGVSKTVRRGYVEWTADASTTAIFTVDIDYADTDDHRTLTNDSTGTLDATTSSFTLKGTGKVFRFSLTESSQIVTSLSKISIYYRDHGMR